MQFTNVLYYCDGCGNQKATEKEMQECEKLHLGKVLVLFVIGNEKINHYTSLDNLGDVLCVKKWVPPHKPDYKLPFFVNFKEHQFLFQYSGEVVSTTLKQKEVPIFRLKDIETFQPPMGAISLHTSNLAY